MKIPSWHDYFLSICEVVASRSPCLSRNIGAVLVQDNVLVSSGYNGPPRGIPHCGPDRMDVDPTLREDMAKFLERKVPKRTFNPELCPRRAFGYGSGHGLDLCPAVHAEVNCLANAARMGVYVSGATLYLNDVIPCKDCLALLTNAGISRIVPKEPKLYDKWSRFIIQESSIEIVGFVE